VEIDDEWVLDPEIAHANARDLMTDDWFWDEGDDDSPFGNDSGADTLHIYRSWLARHQQASALVFLAAHFDDWGVDTAYVDCVDAEELENLTEDEYFHVLTYDDTVLAVAFSQLLLRGSIETEVKSRALAAAARQSLDAVIRYRGWVDPTERLERLARMQDILQKAA
jgi:uncharacterized protein YfeS